jgi:hypothetical protein
MHIDRWDFLKTAAAAGTVAGCASPTTPAQAVDAPTRILGTGPAKGLTLLTFRQQDRSLEKLGELTFELV